MLLTIPPFTDDDYNYGQNFVHAWDIILAPLYFFGLILLGNWYYKKKQPFGGNKKLFINGLIVKLLGGATITLVYNLYYHGGDTTAYFNDGRLLDRIFFASPTTAFRLVCVYGTKAWPYDLENLVSGFRMATKPGNWMVVKISALFSLFSFQSMICTSFFFAFFSYLCSWKFFNTVSEMYPRLKNRLAIVILFIPSVVVWGSGIFKDTITLAGVFLLFHCVYELVVKKKNFLKNLVLIALSVFMVGTIKSYILISFAGPLYIWVIIRIGSSFKKTVMRISFFLLIAILSGGAAYVLVHIESEKIQSFALDQVIETSVSTGESVQRSSEKTEGSTYDIGKIDPSISGIISVAPKAINVTLFRPYLWEANKVMIFFAAIESSLIFLYFVFVLLKNKIIFFFIKILRDPFLFLCLSFTLIIAVFVGVSSYNFGSLVRYKIPCIPFLLITLVIAGSSKRIPDAEISN